MPKIRESHKFPAEMWSEELIQNGHGPCETNASDYLIELFLEHGTLVLYADKTWSWSPRGEDHRRSPK